MGEERGGGVSSQHILGSGCVSTGSARRALQQHQLAAESDEEAERDAGRPRSLEGVSNPICFSENPPRLPGDVSAVS